MEHILQFAINIDDDAIRNRVLERGADTITKNIQDRLEKEIFDTDYYGRPRGLSGYAEKNVLGWLEEHKEQIINYAGTLLAEKMSRSRLYREKVAEVVSHGQ